MHKHATATSAGLKKVDFLRLCFSLTLLMNGVHCQAKFADFFQLNLLLLAFYQ